MKSYEILLIFPSTVDNEGVEKRLEKIRGEVTRAEGKVDGTEVIGLRTFARPLKNKESGFYARLVVSMTPAHLNGFLARLKMNEEIFRYQVTIQKKPSAAAAEPRATATPATA